MPPFFPAPGLIADIGGTNARFALVDDQGTIDRVAVLPCAEYAGLAEIVRAYLGRVRPAVAPRRAAIAVASPVIGDRVTLTNRDWTFSIDETRRLLGLDRLRVVNDFAAVALGIPHLADDDLLPVGGGTADGYSPVAVLGPGTGLGASAIVPAPQGWVPVVTEGGHVTMAAADDREADVLALLRHQFGHVSAERVISGQGLSNLHAALCHMQGQPSPGPVEPAEVTQGALEGDCAVCAEALDLFCAMLGTVAGNLALSLGALGGVYIAGGIVPRLGDRFAASRFRERFEAKGRFRPYMERIPTAVVTHDHPAFVGLSGLILEG